MNQAYSVHAPLEPRTVWVNSDIFYDLETTKGEWVKCKLFGLTCLPNRVPTFEVLVGEGYVFSDIPPHMVRWTEQAPETPYSLEDLVYNNCLSEQFSISQFPELAARTSFIYIKQWGKYEPASYWFSLDFYQNNNWYHAMLLQNGQIAFIPSHKIVFSTSASLKEDHVFPAYKKLRHAFKV